MNADILAVVIGIDEIVSVLDVEPFNGPEHSLFAASVQVEKATLHLRKLSIGLTVPSEGVVICCLLVFNDFGEPVSFQVMFFEPRLPPCRAPISCSSKGRFVLVLVSN